MPIVTNALITSALEDRAEKNVLLEGLLELEGYLCSAKFAFPEGWVSTTDVITRLRRIRTEAAQAAMEAGV